jgi:hypothetical protein
MNLTLYLAALLLSVSRLQLNRVKVTYLREEVNLTPFCPWQREISECHRTNAWPTRGTGGVWATS